MRSIKDEISLKGKLETITATDFRSRPGEVLESVELGKVFILTKRGKAIAVLSEPPGYQLALMIDSHGTITYEL